MERAIVDIVILAAAKALGAHACSGAGSTKNRTDVCDN